MHLGLQIKMERKKQKMKMTVLAEGICSPSQLSRIENGKSSPSDEILGGLEERLGVSLMVEEKPIAIDVSELERQCFHAINQRDPLEAKRLVSEINVLLASEHLEFQTKTNLGLLVLRMRFAAGEKDSLSQELAVYRAIKEKLKPLLHYRVLQLHGMLLYEIGEVKCCLAAFSEAASIAEHLSLNEPERADFAYVYSVPLMVNEDYYEALEWVKHALSYFQTIMAAQRVVECHVISGIVHKKSSRFTKALEQFALAERICRQNSLSSLLGLILQNIGSLHAVMGDSKQAITYFQQAFEQKEKPLEMMYSIHALVEEYERAGNYELAGRWLEKGYCLLPELSEKKKEYYETHFLVFKALCTKNNEAIEKALLTAVRTFKKRDNRSEWKAYAKRLGAFYASTRKYMKAVRYYEMILKEKG